MSVPAPVLAGATAALFASLLTGCAREMRMASAGLSRAGWDSLYVAPDVRGGTPDSLAVLVLAGRDTVLAGGQRGAEILLVHLPDAQLPSDGAFLVEVCAFQKSRLPACAQDALRASPKRFRSRLDVDYPADGADRDRLGYAFAWRVERLRAHGEGYETLVGRTPGNARLHVAVAGMPGAGIPRAGTPGARAPEAGALDVPLRYASGTVSLPRQAGYDAFWNALNDRFFYGDTTEVHVELRAGTVALASRVLRLTPRSREERLGEVQALALAFARTLARYKGGQNAEASDVRWRFDRIQQRYIVEMTSAWQDTTGTTNRLRGKLTVGESGADARFDGRVPGDSAAPVLTYRFDRLAGLTTPSKTTAQED